MVFGRGAWMHQENKIVNWSRPTVINLDGMKYYSTNHTDENLIKSGFHYINDAPDNIINVYKDYENGKIYSIEIEETNQVIQIDTETKSVADDFYAIMTGYFGPGAVTNREITADYVAKFFSDKVTAGTITALEMAHATLLERYFNVLKTSQYNATPHTTWDFPFGQTEIIVEQQRRFYIDKDGEKHYLN